MNEKPEALRLAERIDLRDYYDFDAALHCPDAAIQLRRLHAENERLNAVALQAQNAAIDLTKKNERLREALALAERLAAGRLAMVEQLTDEVDTLRRENERQTANLDNLRWIVRELSANKSENEAEIERLRGLLRDTTVNLGAAVSLLKNGGKKTAASDKMFEQMLVDYTNSFERGRAALRREDKR